MDGAPALVRAVRGARQPRPPIWMMRQAGRYLPEYRALRATVGGFFDLCYSPKLAAEVTLQPMRRFDLDAAILFSDILVIPDALGQPVRFEAGEGPVLEPLDAVGVARLGIERVGERLSSMMETLALVRAALPLDKAVIGFCGAPWTVATYMIGGRGSTDQAAARLFALREPEAFRALLDVLVEVSVQYLISQLRAGADAVQIFESWASRMDEAEFREWVIEPNRRIVEGVRSVVPDAAIVGFPRGAGSLLASYARGVGPSAVGLDQGVAVSQLGAILPEGLPVQGNLDPIRLAVGGEQMDAQVRHILAALRERPHVFNLGHGILPETPIANVERMIQVVREG